MFQQQKSARKIALQALFQADMQGPDFLADILPQFIAGATEDVDVRELATSMVLGAWGYHETADQWMIQFSPRWTISRMPAVDRNILRLAAWELTSRGDVPPKVVLDEAINLAREFSTDESAAFINGVLDAALKDYLFRTGKTL
jgi:N utilization substance protein B